MKHDLVIWDFNGTITDDLQLGIDAVNLLLSRRSLPVIDSTERYHELFRFPVRDYYAAAGFDFEKWPYEELAKEWVEEYNKGVPRLKTHDGVSETIDAVRNAGLKQIVLSSSDRTMLESQLKRLGLYDRFDAVLGLDNIFADGKVEMAKKWSIGKDCSSAILIGDTSHDYETAVALGADCVLFSGGCNSRATLETFGVPVIDRIPDLLRYI